VVGNDDDDKFLKELAEQLLKIAMDCNDGKSRDHIIMAANRCIDRIDPKRKPKPVTN
jgi:hypothetical protein